MRPLNQNRYLIIENFLLYYKTNINSSNCEWIVQIKLQYTTSLHDSRPNTSQSCKKERNMTSKWQNLFGIFTQHGDIPHHLLIHFRIYIFNYFISSLLIIGCKVFYLSEVLIIVKLLTCGRVLAQKLYLIHLFLWQMKLAFSWTYLLEVLIRIQQ